MFESSTETALERQLIGAIDVALVRRVRHDLRTPINHIIGYSEMLLEEAEDSQPALTDILQLIRTDGQLLLHAVTDGLDEQVAIEPQLIALQRQLAAPLARIRQRTIDLAAASEGRLTADLARIADAAARLTVILASETSPTPVSNAAAPAVDRSDPPPSLPNAGRLLVVDDDPGNLDMLGRRLERLGYTIAMVASGAAALELLRREPFDLLLLDLLMPEMDGYEVLRQINADDALRFTPVILLSAADEVATIARGLALGAEDYLPKPFDPMLLQARISATLQKKRLRDGERSHASAIEREKNQVRKLLEIVIPIGEELSKEKDFDRLLEKIVVEAQALCNADGGSLYLRTDDDTLRWVIVRNSSLKIASGGTTGNPISFAPLPLFAADGQPNDHYVVVHTALTGQMLTIADAYAAEGFDFSGTRAFDANTGYRTTSLVNAPLKGEDGRVIGVLQLLNATDPDSGAVVPFDDFTERLLESLARLAAVALAAYAREQKLHEQIEQLKIEIDQARQAKQVAEITETDYFQNLQQRARQLRNRS